MERNLHCSIAFLLTLKQWRHNRTRDERQLTKALAGTIEAEHKKTNFHSDGEVELKSTDSVKAYGRIDILLTPEEKASKTESAP